MGLAVSQLSQSLWSFRNWGTNPANQPGTTITPGTSNAEGTWTQIAAAGDITQEVVAFSLWLHSLSGTGDRQMLCDIGIDPAGGTSYTPIIFNLVCGNINLNSGSGNNQGNKHLFPLLIPAGSSVAVRVKCSSATGVTVKACLEFFGKASNPETFPVGSFAETVGAITNSQGVTFTPGNAADGTWTLLGTTSRNLWFWQLAYSVANATITLEYTYLQLAWGDGSNKQLMMTLLHYGGTNETCADMASANLVWFNCYHPIPAGSDIYIRGRCANAPDTGYNAVAIGVGG